MADNLVNACNAQRFRARWTASLLGSCLVLDVAGVLSGLAPHTVFGRVAAGATHGPEAATNGAVIDAVQLLAFIATGAVWLRWMHRAYHNLRLVGTKRSRFSAGWAVGYWFLPLINLVRPYQIVKELWQRSESLNDRDSFNGLPAPTFLPWWWGMCLLSGVARLLATLTPPVSRLPTFMTATDARMLADAVGVVAAVLAIKVVREITGFQQLFHTQRLT